MVSGAHAQTRWQQREPDAFVQRQRAVEDDVRKQYQSQFGASPRGAFDLGGWYNLNFFLFDDGVESSRTLSRRDLRIWGRVSLGDGAHEFYARGRISLIDFNTGDSFDGDDNDTDGMNLERGTYRFDLARYSQAYDDRDFEGNLVVEAGRDLVEWGTGLSLSIVLDRVAMTALKNDLEVTALLGKTVGSMQDVDLSRTAARTRRTFIGGQARYLGWERHRPFVYLLWQRDHNREPILPLGRDFGFNSFYLGVGSRGELADKLAYRTELVFETGRRAAQLAFRPSSDIEAWAVAAEIEYLFGGPRKARLSAEYLFGSGDSDRTQSPVDTIGGTRRNRRDTSFVGFGFRETGLSFAPRVGNLHMGRVGGSLHPWPEDANLRHFEIGADWYLYYKHHRQAAVSDPTADRRSGYLGWEMDYYANWRVSADMAYTARFGAFFPGRAFSDQTSRTFLLIGLIWSF